MMEVFRILDDIESMIKEARKVPLSNGKVMLDSNDVLDRVDRIRAILPEELETARLVLSEKERIIKEACMQADQYVEESKDRVARMVDDNEITRNAVQMSEQIVSRADQVAAEMRRDANEYADGVLTHMEMVLKKGLETVRQGREELRRNYDD